MSCPENVAFLEALEDVSRGNTRVPLTEVAKNGVLPVVDQGKLAIAGYVDDFELAVSTPGPLIVFGDHTRAVKYVDFPFAMGADGTKLLRPRTGFDARYLYHFIKSINLSSAGYSRHFKYLKEVRVPHQSLDSQRRITSILDKADALRMKRQAQLGNLDKLPQALFNEMFGRATKRKRASELMPLMRNGVSPSTTGTFTSRVLTLSAITRGRFDALAARDATFASEPGPNVRVSQSDLLICRGNGNKSLVGVGRVPPSSDESLVFPDTMIAGRLNTELVLPAYLEQAWQTSTVRRQIERVARTTNGTYKINQEALGNITVPHPPLSAQQEFTEKVTAIRAERDRVARALEADEELFAALQYRAFRGVL